jgi:hypothetical protein
VDTATIDHVDCILCLRVCREPVGRDIDGPNVKRRRRIKAAIDHVIKSDKKVGQRLSGTDVVAVLNRIKQSGRVPGTLFCDNGSEPVRFSVWNGVMK